jgi:signal transduction histidine kinase
VSLRSLPFDWMGELFKEAMNPQQRTSEAGSSRPVFKRDVGDEENFFRPEAFPILDGEQNPAGVILVLKNVTRQMQQDQLKKSVLSTASHQLKTPLTSLRMAVYLLLEEKTGPLTPTQLELLIAARDESDRLHSILTNLLDISRIEAGRMHMDLRATAPRVLVSEKLELFRSEARDRGVALTMEIPADLPDVWADPDSIGHVLANILSNALKYTQQGGSVVVSAQATEEAVCIAVTDTGKGIPAEYVHRVFEQFFRVPSQDGQMGEGLGLAIAKEIVEAHHGAITVQSQEGKGSTFTFCLGRADHAHGEEQQYPE